MKCPAETIHYYNRSTWGVVTGSVGRCGGGGGGRDGIVIASGLSSEDYCGCGFKSEDACRWWWW